MACRTPSRGPARRIASGRRTQNRPLRVVVAVDESFVRTNPREMVDISRLGEAHHWVYQQRSADSICGPLRQLFVRTMKRVAGLECHNIGICQAFQDDTGLRRRATQLWEVIGAWAGLELEVARRDIPCPTAPSPLPGGGEHRWYRTRATTLRWHPFVEFLHGALLPSGRSAGCAARGLPQHRCLRRRRPARVMGMGNRVPPASRISLRTWGVVSATHEAVKR